MLGFPLRQHPSHDVPAVDLEDDVVVVLRPLGQPQQNRDVRPQTSEEALVSRCGLEEAG